MRFVETDKKAFSSIQNINATFKKHQKSETNNNKVALKSRRKRGRGFNTSIPKVPTIPASCFFVKIRENQVMEDQTTFRSIPYLGDDVRLDLTEFNRIVGNIPGQIEPEVCGEAEELLVAYFVQQGVTQSSSKGIIITPDQIQENNVIPEILAALAAILQVSTKEILRTFKVISESNWYHHNM